MVLYQCCQERRVIAGDSPGSNTEIVTQVKTHNRIGTAVKNAKLGSYKTSFT
jgi:hypothetical protein